VDEDRAQVRVGVVRRDGAVHQRDGPVVPVGAPGQERVGFGGVRPAEDLQGVPGGAGRGPAVVNDAARRGEQAAGGVVDGELVIAVQAGEREAREVTEGDGRAGVEGVTAAVGAGGGDDERVVAGRAHDRGGGRGAGGGLEAGGAGLAVGAADQVRREVHLA